MNLQKIFLFIPVFVFLAVSRPVFGQCPTIEAIMVNGCAAFESDGEFMIINTQGTGINVDDLTVDFYSNTTDVNGDIGTTEFCQFMTPPLNAALAGCPNVISVGPGDFIPPNSIVVIMTSTGGNASEYDWTPLCGSGETVYLLQNNCDRTAGAFKDSNAPGETRTTTITIPGCTNSLIYEPDVNSGADGDYILPCTPGPLCPDGVEYGNNGCVVPPVTVPCTPNVITDLPNTTQCDAYVLPAITGSNLSGNEAYYTGPGGTGTQYNAGATISSSITLFMYDATSTCSDEESFSITINSSPVAITPTLSVNICVTIIPPAIVSENISAVENEITGGNGALNVNWYTQPNGTIPINFANALDVLDLLPSPATIYATVDDGTCESAPVPVIANLSTPPGATSVSTTECDEGGGVATFDLTALENNIDGNGNTVNFYTNMAATNLIANPGNYSTTATTVYAVVTNSGGCTSNPVAVNLNVSPPLTADISVSPATGCGSTDVTVTFAISGPSTYDITVSYGNAMSGYTNQTVNVGNGGSFTTTITETSTFVIVAAAFPAGGCPFTFPTSPDEVMIDAGPDIAAISDVNSCGGYTLPAIPYNSNPTGNGAYYTGPNATGTQYNPGAVINNTIQLYAFDGTLPDCFDEVPFTITITQPPSLQLTGTAEVCAGGSFDLSSVVTDAAGSGIPISFHSNTPPNAGNQLPSSTVSPAGNTTYYAFADGGTGCQSTLAIPVTILPLPGANLAALSACDEGGNTATFNLTSLNNTVNGGTGFSVTWFQNMTLSNPINNPSAFSGPATTVYASVNNGSCNSPAAAVSLTVLPAPVANPAGPLEACDNGSGQATFDLTQLNNTINGGSGATVNWFSDPGTNNAIGNPAAFLSGATTVYANIFDGTCTSTPQPVTLTILSAPSAFDYVIEACGAPNAFFDLTTFAVTNAVNGGSGATVNWYTNPAGTNPLFDPSNYVTTFTTIVYATATLNGCVSATAQVTLSVTQAPSATAASLADCDNGSGQGTFNLYSLNNTVNNGSGLIVNYYSDAAANNLINNANNYVSGNATVYAQVQDANCPSEIVPITLTLQPGPTANNQSLSSCNTGNGLGIFDLTSIEFGVSSGTGNVNWYTSLNPLTPVSNDQAYLSGNGQVFAVVDNGTCSNQATITLTVTPGPNVSIVLAQPVDCFGESSAALDVTVTNGVPSFNFDWNVGSLDGTEDPSNLAAGIYNLTVTDGNACIGTAGITITEPNELSVSCNELAPVSVPGGNDGQGTVNITGGTLPYLIEWTGPVAGNQTSNAEGQSIINNLEAGNYSITITDDNDCTTTCNFTINEPGCDLSLDIMGINPLCAGDTTGIIDLTIIGGTSPYDINWSVDSLDGLEDLVNLLAGNYSVTVTDGNGCTANTSVVISAPAALMMSCSQQSPVSAPGGSDGVASIDFSGGTAGYTIEWTGPVSGNQPETMAGSIQINGLPTGDYSITLTDANGCATSCDFSISEISCDLSLDIMGIDPLCAGDTTGIVDLTIIGGTSPYDINWSVDSLDGLEDLVNLLAGNYSVTVTDGNGCTADTSITISAPEALGLSCSQQNPVTAPGGTDGVASIEYSGGTSGYTLAWSGPVSGSQNEAMAGIVTLNGLPAGNYAITLTDANGCSATCDFTIIETNCDLALDIMGINPLCAGDTTGVVDLTIIGGTSPYDINWSVDSLDGLEDLVNLLAGNYSVTVTDGNGCTADTSIVISAPEVLMISCSVQTPVSATGASDGVAMVDFSGGTEGYTLEWSGPVSGSQNETMAGSIQISGLSSGDYSITLTDANGCATTCNFTMNDPGCNMALQIMGFDASCPGEADGRIEMIVYDGAQPLTFDWSDNTLDGIGEPFDIPAGDYMVTVTDGNGCQASTSITLENIFTSPTISISSGGSICEGDCYEFSVSMTGQAPYVVTYNLNDGVNSSPFSFTTHNPDTLIQICPTDFNLTGTLVDFTIENIADANCSSQPGLIESIIILLQTSSDFVAQICPDESMTINGNIYDINHPSGTETLIGANANGCDSIVNVNLSFFTLPVFDLNQTLCEGESIIVNGTTYDQNLPSGTETLTGLAANGCDSIINVTLQFMAAPVFNLNQTLCEGESLVVNGTTYDQNTPTGTETLTGLAANGCDSIINVTLNFLTAPVFDLNQS
ncbi:MAG: hypothetical protein KDC85_17425, partial [Saprospiraceae bacterium]|nr:hypothetical protein [Saprospiraceae bacterium]